MTSRRLFVCVKHNHPFAKIYHYYEEENGIVQEVRMDGGAFNGYTGLMFPFVDLADAVIEINYDAPDPEQVGVLMSKIPLRNYAQPNLFEDEDDEKILEKLLDT